RMYCFTVPATSSMSSLRLVAAVGCDGTTGHFDSQLTLMKPQLLVELVGDEAVGDGVRVIVEGRDPQGGEVVAVVHVEEVEKGVAMTLRERLDHRVLGKGVD